MPGPAADDRPVYVISVAAELAGMHPQTLRTYDRMGLVSPGRAGRARRYSASDIARLREIARLSQQEGVGLAGVRRILALQQEIAALQAQLSAVQAEMDTALEQQASAARRDLVPVRGGTGQQVVVWRRRRS